jgi:2-haloacid dehalogenase
MHCEALVFDAYGTIFDVHSVVARCETLFPGRGTAVSQLWRSKQLEYTWQLSLMRRYQDFAVVTEESLRYVCNAMKLACTEANIASLLEEYLHLATFPEVPAALKRLGGKQLAILSNGSPSMLEPLMKNAGLESTFAAVLSVDSLKVYKPDPRVYELAVKALGVAAKDIGFVSSNCWDACGAKSYGCNVFWINRSGAPVDALGAKPDFLLGNIAELPPLVGV